MTVFCQMDSRLSTSPGPKWDLVLWHVTLARSFARDVVAGLSPGRGGCRAVPRGARWPHRSQGAVRATTGKVNIAVVLTTAMSHHRG